jgi:hypothetical protein
MVKEVLTGYKKPLLGKGEANYDEYTLFCLKTRLQVGLIHKRTPLLMSVKNKGFSEVAVYMENDGILVQILDREDLERIKATIKRCKEFRPDHAIVHYTKASNISSITSVPVWFQIILGKLITLPKQMEAFFMNASLYAKLPRDKDYIEIADRLQAEIITQYEHFWQIGYIVCDSSFAEKWKLTKIPSKNAYYCEWTVPEFDMFMGRFLHERLVGLPLILHVPDTKPYKKKGLFVLGDYVEFPAGNIGELQQAQLIVNEIVSKSS